MAYDEGLAQRIREHLSQRDDLAEKKMFGGLCFMVSGHMCCGILGDTLMARVGPEAYESCLLEPHVRVMDFTGKSMKGMVYVQAPGISDEADLGRWLDRCLMFVGTLPPKS